VVLDVILFGLVIISTLKCISNFEKGLKKLIFRNKMNIGINNDTLDMINNNRYDSSDL
jgi:hypothetical protein